MRHSFLMGLAVATAVVGCKSRGPLSEIRTDGSEEAAPAPTQVQKPRLSVTDLQKMDEEALYELIAKQGTSVDCIPDGAADGVPGKIYPDKIDKANPTKIIGKAIFTTLGANISQAVAEIVWKGKVFKQDSGCATGTGVNRILKKQLITMKNRVFPLNTFQGETGRFRDESEDKFLDALKTADSQGPGKVNLVELNYSNPEKDLAGAARKFGIRDIMVPIHQDDGTKNGSTIFIGRAYVGSWNADGSGFESSGLLAWFFLDFDSRLTVNKLAELDDEQLLQLIADRSFFQPCVPNGDATGLPGRLNAEVIPEENFTQRVGKVFFNVLGDKSAEKLAGALWKGKVFSVPNCEAGTGYNKIAGQGLISMTNRIMSNEDVIQDPGRYNAEAGEGRFVTALNMATSRLGESGKPAANLVELNYSNPGKDFLSIAKNFGIRDLMVPIRQPDGTAIYIGRAYAGKWTPGGDSFKSSGLLAWFFLDFAGNKIDDPFKNDFDGRY